jgi:VIT1/CCC1 family predicted Fe2+/Mn2+ transporter
VSNVGSRNGSRLSTRSRASSKSSIRSSASAKANAAARKAILEAETGTLERLYAIQEEELRLQQRKRQLELQTSIAKANAEERVYAAAQAEAMNNLYTVDDAEDVS